MASPSSPLSCPTSLSISLVLCCTQSESRQ
ncbi:hypothetical protein E2C01_062046 [Portunus trituberculatus]|uniref:Uncharacterized protein n=1 Tax=Portunus trituberculatus TaxID=210409 RepID=A0A5B7H6W4_PORTR|nr:hypothetical protein [Portunus trituberculatus]